MQNKKKLADTVIRMKFDKSLVMMRGIIFLNVFVYRNGRRCKPDPIVLFHKYKI
jgi:hypothetical protein